jgi:hypothetical protein
MRKQRDDLDVFWCWACRKYHARQDYWCPGTIAKRLGSGIFNRWFEWYLKIFAVIAIALTLYVILGPVLGFEISWLPLRKTQPAESEPGQLGGPIPDRMKRVIDLTK